MTKKVLLILGIVLVIAIAAFIMWGSEPSAIPGEEGFSFRDYLPFGRDDEIPNEIEAPIDETPDTEIPNIVNNETEVVRLRKISREPIAGAVVFNIGTTSVVRFIEKGTGNVYEARSDSNTIERLTNTTIPKIVRAFWLPNGSGFLAQTLLPETEIIETSFVKLNRTTGTTSTESLTPFTTTIAKLPTNIKEISIKPDSAKIFYYTVNGSGSSWYISNPDGTAATVVSTQPLTEWIPKWISSNVVALQTKGSSQTVSYTYSFDVANKILRKTGFGTYGLSSLMSADAASTLASNGALQMFLIDNKTVSSSQIGTNTLAEKCVLRNKETMSAYCAVPVQIPGGNYPDSWYKGIVQFEDSIRRVDLKNNVFYNTSDLSTESKEKIDVVDLTLSPDDTHLIFKNKTDGYLWMLRLEE